MHAQLIPSGRTRYVTPRSFIAPLIAEFGLELDVAASAENARLPEYLTEQDNALTRSWAPRHCWMNPPYGRDIGKWTAKARAEARGGGLIVALLPASTDTGWWHRDIQGIAEVRFVKGRIRFVGEPHNSPHPHAVVIWRPGGGRK